MISEIIINQETCIGCGLCTKVCSKKILSLKNNKVSVHHFENWECCNCGLCMSICPTKSIRPSSLSYDAFSDVPQNTISFNSLNDMLASRRSLRCFSEKSIEKEILNKILQVSAMAPIGAPPTNVNAIVIHDPKNLDTLYQSTVSGWEKLVKSMKNPLFRFILKAFNKNKYNALIRHALPAAKIYCEYAKQGKDIFTFQAPAIILFYGKENGVCINENCWLSCTYAILASHSLGLGATISGMIPPIINRNVKIKQQLGLSKKEDVFACFMLGYPEKDIHFSRSIPRQLNSITI